MVRDYRGIHHNDYHENGNHKVGCGWEFGGHTEVFYYRDIILVQAHGTGTCFVWYRHIVFPQGGTVHVNIHLQRRDCV